MRTGLAERSRDVVVVVEWDSILASAWSNLASNIYTTFVNLHSHSE
jgi:hypothetical protein